MTEKESYRYDTLAAHIRETFGHHREPKSADLFTLIFEHKHIHEQEAFQAAQAHVMVPHPED